MDTAGSVIPDNIMSFIRTAAQWGAAMLTSRGVISDSQEQIVVGLVVGALSLGWSFVANHGKKKKLQAAIDAPAGSAG